MSLYTKLGFDWQDACALMRLAPAHQDDPDIRPLTPHDLPAVESISTRHYHASRRNEVAFLLQIGIPAFALSKNGSITGYFIPGILGHGFADTADEMVRLIGVTARHAPPPMQKMLVPLNQSDLHRRLLSVGCRTVKLFNYMTVGRSNARSGRGFRRSACDQVGFQVS